MPPEEGQSPVSREFTGAPAAIRDSIRFGVAGWSYRDWHGTLYPATVKRGRDELALVSQLFDVVEINSSFYREPDAHNTAKWLETVAARPRFRFTAKVTRSLTHERMLTRDDASAVAARLREGLAPLVEGGRLDTVLAQFPPWFRLGTPARDRIARIAALLEPLRVIVEVRHPSFLEARSMRGFLDFLKATGAGFANVDLPVGPGTIPPTTINTSAVGYVRLHGRNHTAWFDPRCGRDEKYDYLYTDGELVDWGERILTVAGRTVETYVITNNHYRAQAPTNAIQLEFLFGRTPRAIPSELVACYPSLRAIAAAAADEEAPR